MWRIKRRRTKPIENKAKTGVIYPKLNATAKPNRYQSRNTYLDVKCNKKLGAGCTDIGCRNTIDVCGNFYSCKTAPYRNPILGYRKHLVDACQRAGYTKDVSGNVYKDNYAKTCATHPEACYNQVIRTKQNKNGCVDESYNYSTNQYLTRRCLKFQQQEFNFQSQVPVDASGSCTKFKSCNNCQYKTNGDCDCSANGFCIGINKLPCEVKNTKCYAIYKRSNPKFKKQGAVSGGSRINRLKYQTRMKAQGRTVNGRNNVINGRRPATLYRTSKPLTLRDNTCINPPPPPSDLSYETLSGSIIVTWRAGDISKLCRIAPLTGFTIQRTGPPFGHTEPVFGNTYTYSNLSIRSYDIRVRADSYYGSSDWAYLYQIPVGNIPSAPVILDNTGKWENEQITFSFTPPPNIPGFPIQSYQYSITSPITFLSSPIAPPANNTIVVAPNYPVINNCVPYTIKMHAINSLGVGDESNSIVVDSIPGDVTFTIQKIDGSPDIPPLQDLNDGKYLLFDIDSNTNTTWNFNITDISNSCPGEAANLKIDCLVVGGGGSGGSYGGGGGPGRSTTGGGGGGEVRTGSFDISGNSSFEIEVGRGDDPTAALAAGTGANGLNWINDYIFRFTPLNSSFKSTGSTLKVTDMASAVETQTIITFAGQHGANTTGRNNDDPIQIYLEATDGGGGNFLLPGGSVLNPDPNGTSYSYATETGTIAFNAPANGFIINMRGSAGGGGNANDGGDSGGTDCSGNAVSTNNFMCSGGNGANGVVSSITGTTQYYGAGGGGAAIAITNVLSGITFGAGGLGGGGDGAYKDQNAGELVTVKGDNGTGYGAGGGGSIFTDVNQSGGNGYRGVVILKFYSVSA